MASRGEVASQSGEGCRNATRSSFVPYLMLFFGSILLVGLPRFRMDRELWLVTVATTVLLLGAMGMAMRKGVG